MLLCGFLEVDAYFHRTCSSESMQFPQPSPFISLPHFLIPCLFLTNPISSFFLPAHFPHSLLGRLCTSLGSYYLQQAEFSSVIFNSFIYFLPISCDQAITHAETHSFTLHHFSLSSSCIFNSSLSVLTYIICIIYHSSPLLGLCVTYWPFHSCVCGVV